MKLERPEQSKCIVKKDKLKEIVLCLYIKVEKETK